MAQKRIIESSGKVQLIIMNFIRFLLVIAFFIGIYQNRNLILFMSILGLFVTFFPLLIRKIWKVKLPGEAEIIVILFIYGILLLTDIRGVFEDYWWWGGLLNFCAAVVLGFVGMTIMYFLYKEEIIDVSPLTIAFFAFCFAIAIGAIWEVFEFTLDSLFGFYLQKSALDTMYDVSFNLAGAFLVSATGYYYIKTGKRNPVSGFIMKIMEKNSKILKSRENKAPLDEVINLIKKGEHEKLEFKSSLRTNTFTKEKDPKIEHAALKTINAYLNSNGGTLLLGVSDKGEIVGLDEDGFENVDKASRHLTSLIKDHIGGECLPYIQHEIVQLDGKNIIKVDCSPSPKHVFLKNGKEEEFYVRNGPSSTKLSGSSLIEYINNKF